MQEAIDWLKRCLNPHSEDCEVEIRPVFELADFGEAFTPDLQEQEKRPIEGAARNAKGGA